jgi:predicted SnoaL-like aldol condensation-catalyzing enzyme
MSTEENKAVVRRFITEVLEGGDLDTIDDVLAPNYVNTAMGVTDLAGFKAMWPAMGAVIPSMRLDIVDLVAEGDAVVARVTTEITLVNGKKIDGRGLTYYRLANGKIVETDPFEKPDLTQELAALMPSPAS